MKIPYIETEEEKDDNEKGTEKTTEKGSRVDIFLNVIIVSISYQEMYLTRKRKRREKNLLKTF